MTLHCTPREFATYAVLAAVACMIVGACIAAALIVGLNSREVQTARTKCQLEKLADLRPEFARRKRCAEWQLQPTAAECVK